MKTKSVILVLAIVLSSSCSKSENNDQTQTVAAKLKSAQVVTASNVFGLNLFASVNELLPDENVFISPFSCLEALSMTYNGVSGTTKDEMQKVLSYQSFSDAEVNTYNKSLSEALLKADRKVAFETANAIYYRTHFSVYPSFIETNKKYFRASVSPLDFDAPEALTTINNWTSNSTHGKIPKLLDAIPPDAVMYLINAIYFKGSWQYAFDASQTNETSFVTESGSLVTQQQMVTEASFKYYAGNDYDAVQMPYGNGTFNCTCILPAKDKKISDVLPLLNAEQWNSMESKLELAKVEVRVPKCKVSFESLLNKPLQAMGMLHAFAYADFSRMTAETGLYISRVIHKTYIDMNEEGTEAAAVTAVEISKTTFSPPDNGKKYFTANRPFIFAITEKSTGVILFIGKIMNPAVSETKLE